MSEFIKSFRGVKRGDIYPTQFVAGEACPPELLAAGIAVGAIVLSPLPPVTQQLLPAQGEGGESPTPGSAEPAEGEGSAPESTDGALESAAPETSAPDGVAPAGESLPAQPEQDGASNEKRGRAAKPQDAKAGKKA